jgi:hypothetical protein
MATSTPITPRVTPPRREAANAIFWGLLVTVALAVLIVIGSRNLTHFDAALIAYTFAVLFATFGLTYRYVMWLQRPPTAIYWKRGWQAFFKRGFRARNARRWFTHVGQDIVLTRFIWRRDVLRGMTHALIMWGCILAIVITFPLVFGWLHFESVPENLEWYRANIFGFSTFTFPVESMSGLHSSSSRGSCSPCAAGCGRKARSRSSSSLKIFCPSSCSFPSASRA